MKVITNDTHAKPVYSAIHSLTKPFVSSKFRYLAFAKVFKKMVFQKNLLLSLLAIILFSPLQAYSEDTVTLNLKDADINTLITTVSEFTGKNFVIDPRVKGKVTVISKHPMDKNEIYEVFLSILAVHGFTTVPAGAVIKIVPDVKAKQGSIPTLTDSQHLRSDQMVTQIIQVKNVAAAQLVPILRPLVPQQGHLAAYPATNVLIISDRASNVARLMKIISRIDKVSDAKIDVIALEHASAVEVVRILTSLLQKGGAKGAASSSRVQLAADERTNSILLSGERSARLRYQVLINHLDTPLSTGGNTRVVYLHYVKAKDLAPILSGVGTSIKASKAKGVAGKPGSKTEINIQADETANALVITAPPDVFRSLQAVIAQLDIRRAQVLIEAVIAEVSLDQSRQFGIQWAAGNSASGANHPAAATQFKGASLTTSNLVSIIQGGSGGIGNGLTLVAGTLTKGGDNIGALITALADDATTNILSTPSIITLDNNEAEIIVGENVPFVTGSFTNTGGNTGSVNPFQTIERQDIGLTLRVTPQINEGDAILLNIEQEISDVLAGTAGASDLITTKRSIKTTVMVEDGQILVLGGLIKETLRQTESKVPLLGDIPIFGYLFRHTKTDKVKTNLMVFIKPTILRDAATNRNVTNSKYSYIRAQQIEMRNRGVALFPDDALPVLPEITNEIKPDKGSEEPQELSKIDPEITQESFMDFDPLYESDDIFD